MSEELSSKYLKNGKIVGQRLGEFEYFQIGSTTFNQLKKSKVISDGFDKRFGKHRPDRLIVDRRASRPSVIAVIEDKDTGNFTSESEKLKAIRQCNNYCQELNSKMGIITDNSETVWINPREKNAETEYTDEITGEKRSYTLIKKEDNQEIRMNFTIAEKQDLSEQEMMGDETSSVYRLIKEINLKISSTNSVIKPPERIDPLPLARRVWQDIWVATGKSPEKCLYNVVEIFIFKFLSDLELLVAPHDFETLYELIDKDKPAEDILKYYVNNCRKRIFDRDNGNECLFPAGEDGTGIINGTIFVDETGKANITQATLFKESIKKFKDFEDEYGKFSTNNIDKDFKTKLYEAFLKQTAGSKALGQFFTPRKVVRCIIEMSGIRNFSGGERFCDPFCGVGGFVLEPTNLNERANDFRPKNKKINPPISYNGYEKGFEKDEERTIILAKANMLIYLSDLIAETKLTKEFARAFNTTFTLWRSNLGTLGQIAEAEDKKFNLILTNPPYVKRGSKTIKNEIAANEELRNFYKINGGGIEGLALEWIIRHLKKGGKAFVIVPDGMLNRIEDKKLRKFILQDCYLDGIISLPQKTFFATPKKTYILAITKKENGESKQTSPVFTYLVSDIGETLDKNRFETPEKNDLPEVINLFGEYYVYRGKKEVMDIQTKSPRCKIQPIEKFEMSGHWCVDRWWSKEERVSLGIEDEIIIFTPQEFYEKMQEIQTNFEDEMKNLNSLIKKKTNGESEKIAFKSIRLDKIINFSTRTNSSNFTKSYVNKHKGGIPVYSASNNQNLVSYGSVQDNLPDVKYFQDCMTWNIDGSVGKVFVREGRFTLSEKVIPLPLLPGFEQQLSKEYLKLAIEQAAIEEGFAFNNKGSKSKLQEVEIKIPIKKDGEFDKKAQIEIAKNNQNFLTLKGNVLRLRDEIAGLEVNLVEQYEYVEKPLSELFSIKQGNSYYTKKRILGNGWNGEIPVYSSNTKEDGILMKMDVSKIKKSDLFYQNCLTWSVDGNAGTLFIRNEKNRLNEDNKEFYFTFNNHCGILLPLTDKIYLPFIKWLIQPIFYKKAKGYGNNKVGSNQITDIKVKIPIDKNGDYDIEIQKEVAGKYEKVEALKTQLIEKLDEINAIKIAID